jgi:DNA repair protein RecN (Recombination protein N)
MHPLPSDEPHSHGQEEIEILISTNPTSPKGPLNKIASGGELSRISLAIQVITAQVAAIPTVVFDEIDVGIGGATAEIVGQLLKALGKRSQVLCVTHQPQVASQGDHHIRVKKTGSKTKLTTCLEPLEDNQKIEEIARMLGGIAITENTLAHAREMLGIRH